MKILPWRGRRVNEEARGGKLAGRLPSNLLQKLRPHISRLFVKKKGGTVSRFLPNRFYFLLPYR
jgi:hypothetical protein